MMTTPNDGGPAFARGSTLYPNSTLFTESQTGMSLRDWFAGQETLSDYDHPDAWKAYNIALKVVNGEHPDQSTEPLEYLKWECEARAKIKLIRADAMLAARQTSCTKRKPTDNK